MAYLTAHCTRPTMHWRQQSMKVATMFPWPDSYCCATLTAWRSMFMRATTREPKAMLPKE